MRGNATTCHNSDKGSDTVDLKDRTNPYAEVSLLMNQKGDLPVVAGLYYTRTPTAQPLPFGICHVSAHQYPHAGELGARPG